MSNPDATPPATSNDALLAQLAADIRAWGEQLGFSAIGICGVDLSPDDGHLRDWLARGHHGEMHYMERHGPRRWRPAELVPGTLRIISARMDYLSDGEEPLRILDAPDKAYVARYALGRDYHKLMRARLAELVARIRARVPEGQGRVFVDSGPVLERALAQRAGLGWIGKNTMLIHPAAGSWFFLGEIYTDLALPIDTRFEGMHCGSCRACLDVCPTRAFTAAFELDARRCISYLTIELKGSIPVELRTPMGNRVFGCDDCQLVCPWNKFARRSPEPDFKPRHGLDAAALVELFTWDEEQFLQRTAGSPIRRLGHERWLRNLAVGLGNGPPTTAALTALRKHLTHPSSLVREHVDWALDRLARRAGRPA